ncbi:hypothetical protein C8A00DRAFT_45678 [Chaetomidium leptoderma]|uniref:Uncharacterized protein n=1 Tax=Chaetomidium leptoderma TaxID=669021 RepID=A0AAN6VGI4_9PEZI|nr:hypothetical protein C8A00DRAFT_45678 [Chaetomidium leptoderma]
MDVMPTTTCLFPASRTLRIKAPTTLALFHARAHTKHISPIFSTTRSRLSTTQHIKMASPIPLASFGANPEIAEQIRRLLLPEYEIVHICTNLSDATAELPQVCAGRLDTPAASGLGSNASVDVADRKAPKAIIFGGGIPDDEVTAVTEAVHGAAGAAVKVVRVTRADILATGATGPSAEVIAGVLRGELVGLVEAGELV